MLVCRLNLDCVDFGTTNYLSFQEKLQYMRRAKAFITDAVPLL